MHLDGNDVGVAAAAGVTHHATSISIRSRTISSPAARRAGHAALRASAGSRPAGSPPAARGTPTAPATGTIVELGVLADRPLAEDAVGRAEQLDLDAGEPRRSARARDGRPRRRAARASASTRSSSAWTIEYSCIGSAPAEARRAALEEPVEPSAKSAPSAMRASCSSSRSRWWSRRSTPAAWLTRLLATASASVGPAASRRAIAQHLGVEAVRRERRR